MSIWLRGMLDGFRPGLRLLIALTPDLSSNPSFSVSANRADLLLELPVAFSLTFDSGNSPTLSVGLLALNPNLLLIL